MSYRRANPTTPALLQLQDGAVESYGPHAELASSFPYVILNLSNFSGLVNNESHPRIQHRFGNATSDLDLFYEKVAGFYDILHEAMGEDGAKYCPLRSWMHVPTCITIATCLLQSSVPQHISMHFYSSIMEQAARFEDITWQIIATALAREANGQQHIIRDAVPSKYRCDEFEEASQVAPNTEALLEVSGSKTSATLAFSAALQRATHSTHRLLDAHELNSSMDVTLERLEDIWRPMCRALGCDASNHWDIFLSSHQQTTSLLQTTDAAMLRREILERAKLEQRVQRFASQHAEALQGRLWRPYNEGPNVQKGEVYADLGRAAVTELLGGNTYSIRSFWFCRISKTSQQLSLFFVGDVICSESFDTSRQRRQVHCPGSRVCVTPFTIRKSSRVYPMASPTRDYCRLPSHSVISVSSMLYNIRIITALYVFAKALHTTQSARPLFEHYQPLSSASSASGHG